MNVWPAAPSRRFSGSVGKAFQVLATFTVARPELTASEIAIDTGLDRSTTHRFLTTLVDIGVLTQDAASRRYRLGLRLLDYAYVILNTLELRRIALSHLHELHRGVEGTLSLAVRDGTEVVLVERSFGPWVPAGGFEVGQRLPMHASASGLAILAWVHRDEIESLLDELPLVPKTPRTVRTRATLASRVADIRRDGYSTSDEELLVGLRSIAVPIMGADGTAVASLSLARRTSVDASMEEVVRQHVPRLREVAERISLALGHRQLVH
jgi:IclR family transcriptional regulator, pca regulon regulatory protein